LSPSGVARKPTIVIHLVITLSTAAKAVLSFG
jgi:hypothetical protein